MSMIFSSFADRSDAQRAVGALLDRGARKDDIDLVADENRALGDGGPLHEGISGYLADQGVSADAVRTYQETVKNGGALLALRIPTNDFSEVDAFEILATHNAKQNVYGSRA
jgi:hypothetical protein